MNTALVQIVAPRLDQTLAPIVALWGLGITPLPGGTQPAMILLDGAGAESVALPANSGASGALRVQR